MEIRWTEGLRIERYAVRRVSTFAAEFTKLRKHGGCGGT
jgi:hypothetical protein